MPQRRRGMGGLRRVDEGELVTLVWRDGRCADTCYTRPAADDGAIGTYLRMLRGAGAIVLRIEGSWALRRFAPRRTGPGGG